MAERILPVLSVFAEWAWEHPRYLILQSERSLGNQNLPSATELYIAESSSTSLVHQVEVTSSSPTSFTHLAPSDVLLGENDARLQMKTAVCVLLELVEASIRCIPGASGTTLAPPTNLTISHILSHLLSHPLTPSFASYHTPSCILFHLLTYLIIHHLRASDSPTITRPIPILPLHY